MFGEVEGLLQKATSGQFDQSALAQAASDHVSTMDQGQLAQHGKPQRILRRKTGKATLPSS